MSFIRGFALHHAAPFLSSESRLRWRRRTLGARVSCRSGRQRPELGDRIVGNSLILVRCVVLAGDGGVTTAAKCGNGGHGEENELRIDQGVRRAHRDVGAVSDVLRSP